MSRTDPTLVEAVEAALRSGQAATRTLIPATVIAYDPATNTATVLPSRLQQPADGGTPTPLPQVTGPVVWPRTGAWVMWTDLMPGDSVAIMCADRSIAEWRKTPPGVPVAPRGARMHSLTDAVIIPGLWPDVAPITPARVPGTLYLGSTLGVASLTLSPADAVLEATLVRLGSAAVSFAIKGTELSAAISAFTGTVSGISTTLATAAGAWATAAGTWAGLPGAPAVAFSGACSTFGGAVATFAGALGAACGTLASATAASVSTKVQVQ